VFTGWYLAATNPNVQALGRTNYLGVAGRFGYTWGFERNVGVFANRSEFRPNDVLDGTSNTLMVGEGVFGYLAGNAASRQRAGSWFGAAAMPTYFGMTTKGQKLWYQFSSNHPGVVQFCYIDGSVRAVKTTTSQSVYERVSDIRGGVPADIN
jgi:hypothetical protein